MQRAGLGALLGALAGLLLGQLGARDILGNVKGETIVVVCVAIGAVVGWIVGVVAVAAVPAALLMIYLFVAYSPVVAWRAPAWVRADSLPAKADAVVVLSADVMSDSTLNARGLDRLLAGVELIERGVAPRIVTSRVAERYDAGLVTSDADQRRVLALGRVSARWDVIGNAHSTRDEAVGAARLLLAAGARSIVVVTSPMHTRRACAVFEAVGFAVACRPASEHAAVTWHPEGAPDRLAAFRELAYEELAMVKYRWKGWVTGAQ
ncbi:MAG TPA: YdcF family protein [Gemmatimonadaceae bacterium]